MEGRPSELLEEAWTGESVFFNIDDVGSSVEECSFDTFRDDRQKVDSQSFLKRYGTDDHMTVTHQLLPGLLSPVFANDSPILFNEDEWQEISDYSFLDDLELVPSDDDLEKADYKVPVHDWRDMFFKVFATKIRRSKLVLRTNLPKIRKSSRIRYAFVNGGTKLRSVHDELDNCHRETQRCFNFQRFSYIVSSERSSGSMIETIEYNGYKYEFQVGEFSTINPICLWDFNAFWNSEKNFQVATDISPYLSMMASQWKDALEAERVGRWIMMYKPAAVNFLKGQGEAARVRSESLKEIHSFSRLLKLVLSEYIFMKKLTLLNGEIVKGKEIVRFLTQMRKNDSLFLREYDLKNELEMCEFVLNPDNGKNWQELLNDGTISPHMLERERLMRKTIFLCDPIHWTLCLQTLLEEKIKALKHFMAGSMEVTQELKASEQTSRITYTRAQAKKEIKAIKDLMLPLPKLKDLDDYIFVSSPHFMKGFETGHKKANTDIGLFNMSGLVNERLSEKRLSGRGKARTSLGTSVSRSETTLMKSKSSYRRQLTFGPTTFKW